MSEEPVDRTFERWALAGACALALVGLAAFWVRRVPPDVADASEDVSAGDAELDDAGDLVRLRIGGARPLTPLPDPVPARGNDFDVNPDPGPNDGTSSAPSAGDVPARPRALEERTVVVRSGETLSQIAQRELGTVRRLPELLELNGIEDPDDVRAGATLKLPAE